MPFFHAHSMVRCLAFASFLVFALIPTLSLAAYCADESSNFVIEAKKNDASVTNLRPVADVLLKCFRENLLISPSLIEIGNDAKSVMKQNNVYEY